MFLTGIRNAKGLNDSWEAQKKNNFPITKSSCGKM